MRPLERQCRGGIDLGGAFIEMARDQYKLLLPADQSGRLVSADLRLQKEGSSSRNLSEVPNTGEPQGRPLRGRPCPGRAQASAWDGAYAR